MTVRASSASLMPQLWQALTMLWPPSRDRRLSLRSEYFRSNRAVAFSRDTKGLACKDLKWLDASAGLVSVLDDSDASTACWAAHGLGVCRTRCAKPRRHLQGERTRATHPE